MSTVALWAGVAVAGGLASVARFLVHEAVSALAGTRLALGTLAVNLSGSFVLGLLVGTGLHGDAYLLSGTAAVGSYTTFSTWIFDSSQLGGRGRRAAALANIVLSLGAGLGAVALGRAL
jgi:CrcB protein